MNFITDVTTTNACDGDNEAMEDIQEKLESREIKPEEMYVDKGYVTGDTLSDSYENEIKLMGEVKALDNKALFTIDEFTIDYNTQTATCPAGSTSCSWHKLGGKNEGKIEIRFGKQCQQCPLKEKCTTSKQGRKLRLHRNYEILKERREECKKESFKKAMKRRPPVEGTISELVRAHGIRRSRYRSMLKTHLHNLLSSLRDVGDIISIKSKTFDKEDNYA